MQASKPQRQSVRRPRGSLTDDAIVEAAFAIAADSSIEEVSIPLVAKSLDVGVTSIYWHVRNKSELLDAMTDRALRRSGLPAYASQTIGATIDGARTRRAPVLRQRSGVDRSDSHSRRAEPDG